jgi:hypothetical protein
MTRRHWGISVGGHKANKKGRNRQVSTLSLKAAKESNSGIRTTEMTKHKKEAGRRSVLPASPSISRLASRSESGCCTPFNGTPGAKIRFQELHLWAVYLNTPLRNSSSKNRSAGLHPLGCS